MNEADPRNRDLSHLLPADAQKLRRATSSMGATEESSVESQPASPSSSGSTEAT
ncbi:hypothetical protein [Streptomyces pratensis]|uniref:hypothetical protein n=1 Tax=Streptomyces pratensis TaxID=1169025 RepID=UPI0019337EAA|nr:hypothetical protein [Streptomyces pratensis]